jgi:glycine cleavage system protein P-like pyridoxal-binding family
VEWPKIARNTMMIDLETQKAKGEDIDQFIANVLSTVKVCAENAEGQQLHVDTFRELAKSGVLVLPED